MSRRNLSYLFSPRSVAVIGASDRPNTIGSTVFRNLTRGGFEGPVWPVNRKRTTVGRRRVYASVADLPETPELAVICTPAPTVPSLIAELGEKGTRAAIVISAGLEAPGPDGRPLQTAMLDAAKPYLLRILGPNCIGVLSPRVGLNASFAHTDALSGTLAFISQSGALTTAMLDWARRQGIGFSYFASLGNSADVDFGDLLDFLCNDPYTRAILLYVESITHARKFMSAARAAARNKPVIVVKAGRAPEGAKAATSHTGALAGSDDVYEAAFRRAGMLRVKTTRELFGAAETLARMKPVFGERLAIVSNGGGPAVMATDALIEEEGVLASLSPETMQRLNGVLPSAWSHGNPIDIVGDAPSERYVATLEASLADSDVDALLLIHAPTAIVDPTSIARACAPMLAHARKATLTCWMGGEAVDEAKAACAEAGIPTYSTPEEAVGAFLQVVRYQRNQQQLMESPSSLPENFASDISSVRAIIESALAEDRPVLMEHEAKAVLAAYGVPVVNTRVAHDVAEARSIAQEFGFPLVLKILSPDITHKSDVGGVVLNIASVEELQSEAEGMLARCKARKSDARILGFTLQPMVKRSHAIELIAGMTVDPTFGPVLLFGQGGTAVEAIADKAVALPPLNMALARELVSRTRVQKLLAGYRSQPPVDAQALHLVLVQLSQLIVDFPEVVELDINPLLADEKGVIGLDARVRVEHATTRGSQRLAIRPYPKQLEEHIEVAGRHLLLRPLRPEDLDQHKRFLTHVNAEDMRTRFFSTVRELPTRDLAALTQIDYERAMAFIAVEEVEKGVQETLGVARAYADPENYEAEFAILVRSDLKGLGLGTALLSKLIRYCKSRGIQRLVGEVLTENTRMLRLAQDCGFHAEYQGDGTVRVAIDLQSTEESRP